MLHRYTFWPPWCEIKCLRKIRQVRIAIRGFMEVGRLFNEVALYGWGGFLRPECWQFSETLFFIFQKRVPPKKRADIVKENVQRFRAGHHVSDEKWRTQIFLRSCITAIVVLWPKMKAPQISVTTPQTVRTTLDRNRQKCKVKQKIQAFPFNYSKHTTETLPHGIKVSTINYTYCIS